MLAERSAPLPSGLVTFVFTDIEGSTKILKRLPDAAPEIFERHDAIIRAAIQAHRGHEVSAEGDAFLAAFERSDEALAACADAQRALGAEPWTEGGEVRVRMGVHAGLAAPRNDNYVALAVHQAARVVAAAHGGQIVVSDTAVRGTAPPPATRLTTLGRFRIRDFDEAVELHRLDPDDVPVAERPVRATPAGTHNLVRPSSSLVGREQAVEEVAELISAGRVVSLVGPGGAGKTRLAIEVGLRTAAERTDGVWLIELADISDSSLVPAAIVDAVAPARADGAEEWHDLLRWAEQRRALLIVDNIEAHVATCGELIADLLALPGIAVMTTSREPLHISGESVYRVAPLEVATPGDRPDVIRRCPAVRLFVDRARAKRPDFDLDDRLAADVARLCARLDGLPLAIEIAAARVGVLSVSEIVAGLDDRFRLLRSAERNRPVRQRTMRDLLAWSHDLLEPAERAAFRRLAVFGGTFTLDAAVAALADDELAADDVPELVWTLVDKSLVVADLAESGTRYRLPETVRDYGEELLVEHGDGAVTARRAGAWLLGRVGPWLTADRRWIGGVGDELANIRALVDRLAPVDEEAAQALVCTLARYHDAVQSFGAGIDELGSATARLTARTPTLVSMLTALADLHLRRAGTAEAEDLLARATTLCDEVGQPAWNDVAIERTRGELLCRASAWEDAVTLARETLRRELSPLGRARMDNLDGIARYAMGDLTGAATAFQSELEIYERLGLEANIASAHGNLAEIAMHLGDRRAAATHQQACLDLALVIGQPVMLAYSSLVASRLAAELGEWTHAVRLVAWAESELEDAGLTLYPTDRAVVDELWARATDRLGDRAVRAEGDRGEALDSVDVAPLASAVFETIRSAWPDRPDPPTERNMP